MIPPFMHGAAVRDLIPLQISVPTIRFSQNISKRIHITLYFHQLFLADSSFCIIVEGLSYTGT